MGPLAALAALLASQTAREATAAPTEDPAQSALDRAAARESVARAQAAARAGDYASALAAYEHALTLRPAPQLHYNIGVCHQHLAAEATDDEARQAHLRSAIAAYNEYLRRRPNAPDAPRVIATIEALGGVADRPGHWEAGNLDLFDPDAPVPNLSDKRALWDQAEPPPSPAQEKDDAQTPATDASAASARRAAPPPVRPPRAALSIAPALASLHPYDTTRAGAPLDVPLAMGAAVEAVALLGPKRRAYLGGAFDFAWPLPIRDTARLGLAIFSVSFVGGAWFDLGASSRVAVGVGGGVGAFLESLRRAAPGAITACGASDGRTESHRFGLQIDLRPALAVQLGPNRAHALVLAVRPILLAAGTSWSRSGCPDEFDPPFSEVGLPPGAAFAVAGGLGYRGRF